MKFEIPKFAFPQRVPKAPDPPGVTVPEWLVRATKFASWVATLSLIYFLWLYTLDIARDRAESMHLTHVGAWVGDWQFWFPHVIGFAAVAMGIPYVAKIAIPTFVSLRWDADPTAKAWALGIAVAVSIVVISGTFAVQGHTIMERDRDAAVAVEQVQQGRAVLEAQIASKQQELADMMNNRNAYLAQAASVGAEEWQRSYIDRTPENDPQRDRIVRALGAARAADAKRAEIAALREQLARSQGVASVQREVVTERTGWIASTLGWLEGVRAILLSFVMDIVALIMPLISLRLEQARNRQLGLAAGIPQHPWMLEDKRGVAAPAGPRQRAQDVAEAMMAGGADPRFAADMARSAASFQAAQELAFDEDGTPLTEVRYFKRADGKPLVKNQKNKVVVPPGPPQPDETGVEYDGGGRVGLSQEQPERDRNQGDATDDAEQPQNLPGDIPFAPTPQQQNSVGATQSAEKEDNTDRHPEPSYEPQETLSDEEAVALAEEYALAAAEETAITNQGNMPEGGPAQNADDAGKQVVAVEADDYAEDKAEVEGDVAQHTPPTDRQPETREDRLLPAVAAE